MKLRARIAVTFVLALSACSEGTTETLPPTDRLYFPIGLATTHVTVETVDTTALLVASDNFDLRYSAPDGGTLLSIDSGASVDGGPLRLLGDGQRIGSFAGPVAVADGATCAVAGPAYAIVASRYDDQIYQFGIGSDGALTCGAGCALSPPRGFKDPFAVAVACRAGKRRAFVGYLSPPKSSVGSGFGAWITELDLNGATLPREIELGDGPVRAMAYDSATDRLWATTQSSGTRALLHSVDLSNSSWNGAAPQGAVTTFDLSFIHGAELHAIAIGSPPATGGSRLFITARLYDVEVQASSGVRPAYDIGGVLIVLDVADSPATGLPVVSVRDVVSLGLGVGDVAVVKRGGGEPDLAVATASGEGLLYVYDDLNGRLVQFEGRDTTGLPVVGDRPMALAVDQPGAGGAADVYVAVFGSHLVRSFQLNPASPSAALVLKQIGGLAP